MDEVGLAETIAAVRTDLARAIEASAGESLQFPVGQVTLEFQIAVARSTEGKAGIKICVVELGAAGKISSESMHTVTVVLQAPTDLQGRPVKVVSRSKNKPA